MTPVETVQVAPDPDDPQLPTSDLPAERTYDWKVVHAKALSTAHAGQAWGAGGTALLLGGVVLRYGDIRFGEVDPPTPTFTGWMVGLGAGLATVSEVALAAGSLRSRYAVIKLGGRDPGWAAGAVSWGCIVSSSALWVTWGALEYSGESRSPAVPALATVFGAGAWAAATVQLSLDKQHEAENGGLVLMVSPHGITAGAVW